MSSIDIIVINELIIDPHRLNREFLCSHRDDAIGYYDKNFRNYTILNSRKFRIPNNICKIHCYSHDNIQFNNQIRTQISRTIYKRIIKLVSHGAE